KDQAQALESKLNDMQDDYEFSMYIGLKHIEPFIEDAVEQMAKDGITEAVSIVLAPHYSTFSVKSYNGRAQEEAKRHGIKLTSVESWYNAPGFIQYWAEQITKTYEQMTEEEREKAVLIVSAHSLPEKILQDGDPYTKQLEETAKLISEQTGITDYEIGWQSEGNTPDPWIGPDVQDLTRDLYEQKGYTTFVYAPVGFVSDHLEVLYDNDYECKVVSSYDLKQLEETAKLISEQTGITDYEIGWQSEGNTPDPWIGPDVQDLTRDLYEQKGYTTFVYAPVGFVSDHLEVLYDNDYECKVVCDEIGASYYRPNMPNTHPLFIQTLADVVFKKVQRDA